MFKLFLKLCELSVARNGEESDDIIFSHLLRHSANQVRQLPRGKNNFCVICVHGMGSELLTILIFQVRNFFLPRQYYTFDMHSFNSINISTMKIILCLLFFMLTTCRSYRKKTSIRLQLQISRLLKYRKPTDDLCQMTYNSVKTMKDMLPFWDLRYVTVLITIINH